MKRFRRTLAAGVGGLVGLAGLAGGAFYGRARRALPQTRGRINLSGLRAPVEVLRDRWGVPHIYADHAEDLLWAQGYVHASERLWQMEFQRRVATGRLAEMLGAEALDVDRFIHTIGLPRAAASDVAQLSDEGRTLAERYVAGVNAAIEGMGGSRTPIEFVVLRHQPRPWTLIDSLAWGKMIALAMAGNWEAEIVRAQMIARLGAERAAALEPEYPQHHHHTVVELSAALGQMAREGSRIAAETLGFGGDGVESLGSNAWAVHPSRSASGRAILAADPHLSLGVPSIWMENHLCGGGLHVTGASFPGVPGVLIGHNEHIAWGITNSGIDAQDLYIERLNHTETHYQTPAGWQPVEVEHILIPLPKKPAVQHTIQHTRHGPLLAKLDPLAEAPQARAGQVRIKPSDLPADVAATSGTTYGLALRWTAHAGGAPMDAMLQLSRASNWSQFRSALSHWSDPTMNFVYAGPDGIGYQLAGRVPRRPNGPSLTPARGWTDEAEWDGYLPAEELPHTFNPTPGVVVSANNRIVQPHEYQHHLSQEWMNGYRAERISSALAERSPISAADCARLQHDFVSLPGQELVELARDLLRLPATANQVTRSALAALLAWDGRLDADSTGGAIYQATLWALQRLAFAELGPLLPAYLGTSFNPLFAANATTLGRATPPLLAALRAGDRTPFGPDLPAADTLLAAFEAGVQQLRGMLGDAVPSWQWGQLHQVSFAHALAVIPVLNKLFSIGPLPLGGDTDTVCQLGFHPTEGYAGAAFGPSFRQVVEVGDWDNGRSILHTGQSGHLLSRHYRDYVGMWSRGEYHPQLWSRQRVEAALADRLVLHPKDDL